MADRSAKNQIENRKNTTNIAVIATDISYIKGDISDIKGKLERDYVTRQELEPIKKLVYGMVTIILSAVIIGLMGLILIKR